MTTPSFAQAVPVRSGVERATLVRRTYAVVFLGIIITCAGAAFAMTQPSLMSAVSAHPFITMIAVFAPLLYMAERSQPGVTGQAAMITLGTFGALTAYAAFSRRDFSAWGSFFMIG